VRKTDLIASLAAELSACFQALYQAVDDCIGKPVDVERSFGSRGNPFRVLSAV